MQNKQLNPPPARTVVRIV